MKADSVGSGSVENLLVQETWLRWCDLAFLGRGADVACRTSP